MAFSKKLIAWYLDNARQLPWRNSDNPYYIWLSEIILQQTRIEQGLEYYRHFITAYPTVLDLANASERQVLKSWQGLGYYSRARNLHAAARYVAFELGGRFPDTYEGILKLKGVGPYTASAIASFAYRLPYPVIDGNVYRFVSRLYDVATPIATPMAYQQFREILCRLIDTERPDLFNQAMMDFGSTFCKPMPPNAKQHYLDNCLECPFRQQCLAFQREKVDQLPVRAKPTSVVIRYFYYIVIRAKNGGSDYTLLHHRTDNDIWKGLYEFPLLESESPWSDETVKEKVKHLFAMQGPVNAITLSQPYTHKLTHRTIVARFIECDWCSENALLLPNTIAVPWSEIKKYPVSRLIDKYLSTL